MVFLALFLLFLVMANIKKKHLGSKIWHKQLNQYILIKKGNEDFYKRLGLDIFTQPRKPKLIKDDKNQ